MSCGIRTYGAAITGLAPGTAATFAIAELDGSATKKIRLNRIGFSGTQVVALVIQNLRLTKLSSISTGGTATTGTNTPFDSANTVAATAVFRGFTVAPTGGGTVLGTLANYRYFMDIPTTLMAAPAEIVWDFSILPFKARPTLNSAAEAFAIDFNGATPAQADILDIYAWWSESTE